MTTSTAKRLTDAQERQVNNFCYLLLGMTLGMFHQQEQQGVPPEEMNLFLEGSSIHHVVRDMGRQINTIGGLSLMQDVAHYVFVRIEQENNRGIDPEMTDLGLTQINAAWHGIGDWQR